MEDLPESTVSENADLPFAAVRGMRNRLAHGYSEIDVAMLWETISSAIPTFTLSTLPFSPHLGLSGGRRGRGPNRRSGPSSCRRAR